MRLGKAEGGAAPPRPLSGAEDGPLFGSWSATRWQYTRRTEAPQSVDVVCDLGGTVTLSLSAGTYVLTYDVAGRGNRSEGGSCAVVDDRLHLTPQGIDVADVVRFRIAAETLSLSAETSAWDFAGAGEEEVADFVAVLVRL